MKTNCRSSILLHKGGDYLLISVDRAEFLAAIKRATAIAPPDSPLDVLKGVLLETDSNDLEDISRRAHEKTGFTYTPLSEIAALN